MSDAHNALITEFYRAFQRLDADAMSACYGDDVIFSDPAFGELRGRDVGEMWRMLTTRAKDFSLTFDQVRSDDTREMRRAARAGDENFDAARRGLLHVLLHGLRAAVRREHAQLVRHAELPQHGGAFLERLQIRITAHHNRH